MTYHIGAIANYFLDLAQAEDKDITHLKLQKLLYFAYGWYLALAEEKLFGSPIEAWKFGPVSWEIYHEFKGFRDQPIKGRYFNMFGVERLEIPNDSRLKNFLKQIWTVYGKFDALQLANMTHEPGTPWHQVYQEGIDSIVISDEVIKEHFRSKVENRHA